MLLEDTGYYADEETQALCRDKIQTSRSTLRYLRQFAKQDDLCEMAKDAFDFIITNNGEGIQESIDSQPDASVVLNVGMDIELNGRMVSLNFVAVFIQDEEDRLVKGKAKTVTKYERTVYMLLPDEGKAMFDNLKKNITGGSEYLQ